MEPTAEASRRAVNATYPPAGRWSFTINRLVAEAGEGASDVNVTHGALIGRAITLSTVRDGRTGRQVEFWSDSFRPRPGARRGCRWWTKDARRTPQAGLAVLRTRSPQA